MSGRRCFDVVVPRKYYSSNLFLDDHRSREQTFNAFDVTVFTSGTQSLNSAYTAEKIIVTPLENFDTESGMMSEST